MHRTTPTAVAVTTLILAAAAHADGTTTVIDFETGAAGWSISGGGFIDAPDGNPGSWLHSSPGLSTFAPIVRSTTGDPVFTGDLRAMGVTSISMDAQLLDRDFGDPVGFQMSLLLRDTKGTPNDPADDDYAYFVGPQVPLIGQGWLSYEFSVPSQSTDAVPEGWSGGWGGDLENFRPGVDWNDVITNVDSVEFWWIHPAFQAIIIGWDCGVDNIGIRTAASCPWDLDRSGSVGTADLLDLLSQWGSDPGGPPDFNGDMNVGTSDLLELLSNWGRCPK